MSDYEFWDELGNIFNAVVAYQRKTVEFNKRFVNPWIRMGSVFDKDDRSAEAVSAYRKALEIDPGDANSWLGLGDAFFKLGSFEDAATAYQKAVELQPTNGWAYANLALTRVTQQDYTDAINLYITSLEHMTEEKDRSMIWNRLGNAYRKVNDYENAFIAFQMADESDAANTGFSDPLDEASPEVVLMPVDEEATPEGPAGLLDETMPEEALVQAAIDVEVDQGSVEEVPAPESTLTSEVVEEPAETLPEPVAEPVVTEELAMEAAETPAEPVAQEDDVTVLHEETVLEVESTPVVSSTETLTITMLHSVETIADPTEFIQPTIVIFEETLPEPVLVEVGADLESAVTGSDLPAEPEVSEDVQLVTAEMPVEEQVVETPVADEIAVEISAVETPVVESVVVEPEASADVEVEAAIETQPEPEAEVTVQETAPEEVQPIVEEPAEHEEQNVPVNDADAQSNESIIEEILSLAQGETTKEPAYEEFLQDSSQPDIHVSDAVEEQPAPVQMEESRIVPDTRNAHVWNELGNVYFNAGAYEDAIASYQKAIELDGQFAWPYSNLALAYVQKEKYLDAVVLYQRSIELFSNDKDKAVTWNRLGSVYRRLNDYDNAIASYQRADDLDPNNAARSLRSRFSLLGSFSADQTSTLAS